MNKTLGTKIGELRKEKGLKQDEVAEKLGVSAQAVSKWENDVSCPDIMMLPKLAGLLEVSVDELLSGNDERLPETKYLPPEARKNIDDMMLRLLIDSDGDATIRINLPIPLIKVLLESGGSLESITGGAVGNNIDLDKIMTMVENGMFGKLVEIEADGDKIEITVE